MKLKEFSCGSNSIKSLDTIKVILPSIAASIIIYVSGCSNNNVTNPAPNPVYFDMYDTLFNDTLVFIFHPRVDLTIDSVVETLSQHSPYTIISNNPAYQFSSDSSYLLGHDTTIQIQSGQQWTFTYTGKIVSNNNRYTTSTYFKVP